MKVDLGNDSIGELVIKMSIPAILSMVAAAIYNLVDRIFVGYIDPLALTAVGITMPFQNMQMAFVLMIGVGMSTIIAIANGEGRIHLASKYLKVGTIYFVLGLSLATFLSLIFLKPLFRLLGVSTQVYPYARDYIVIMLIGGVPGLTGYCLNNVVRALGYSKEAMKFVVISNLLNIALDYLLVIVIPLGIKGAAIATVISQTLVTIYVFDFFKKNPVGDIRTKLTKEEIKKNALNITSQGIPNLYKQVIATFVTIFINRTIISYGGDFHLASVTIITSLSSFFLMVVYGIGTGVVPIIGYNYGAKKTDRTNKTLIYSSIFIFLYTFAIWLMIMVLPEPLISLFTRDSNLIYITSQNIKYYLLGFPLIGILSICTTYLEGIKEPKIASRLYILKYLVLLVPTTFILAPKFGTTGIYLSNSITDIIGGIVCIFILLYFIKYPKIHKEGEI